MLEPEEFQELQELYAKLNSIDLNTLRNPLGFHFELEEADVLHSFTVLHVYTVGDLLTWCMYYSPVLNHLDEMPDGRAVLERVINRLREG